MLKFSKIFYQRIAIKISQTNSGLILLVIRYLLYVDIYWVSYIVS